jgi:hypothetical protein
VIQNFWENAIFSVTPTILVGLIFWLVMEAEERARLEQVAPAAAAAPVREAPASTREA